MLALAALTGCAGGIPAFVAYDEGLDDVAGIRREGRLRVRWSRRMAPELEGPFLPIERAVRFEMIVNLKSAKALELTIPESFLFRADQVIE